jgi:hypothetical protein
MNRKKKQVMMKNSFILFLVLIFGNFICRAQKDTLLPLSINPLLIENSSLTKLEFQFNTISNDTIEIPFLEDFSSDTSFPDTSKWLNSEDVFINRTFGKNPPTIGVATFDGLKSNGYPYRPLVNSGAGNADTLTSKFIRLDSITFPPVAITPLDSVYFSFYYQPKGFGHTPLNTHTLSLDFYNPTSGSWINILNLSRSGNSAKDTLFTKVMIPITNPDYFKKQFRFRFRNKNTGSGNVNHWHIDNIYLGRDRTIADTSFNDLSYVYPGQSLLKDYTSIPYNHYIGANQMSEHSYLKIRNNDQYATNFTSFIKISDYNSSVSLYDTTGSDNAQPFFATGYVNNPDIVDFLNSTVSPDVASFSFNNGNVLTDSVTYLIKHYMRTSAGDRNKTNDTLVFKQKFNNYFSYDDGSAELAWGLQGTYGAETAVQFQLFQPDTLRAIDLFFNPVSNINAISNLLFGLRVWNDGGGSPGTLIYDDGNSMNRQPIFYSWGNNFFARYYLNYPLALNNGICYVGLKQDDQQTLNIGFDQNTNTQTKLFYNTNGFWANSSFKGSLMLRPIFGDSASAIGIKNNSVAKNQIKIFPNPANHIINVSTTHHISAIEILDASGKRVFDSKSNLLNQFNISALNNGFYFLKIYSNTQLLDVQKLIINRND